MLSIHPRPPSWFAWASLFVLWTLLWSCVGTTDRGLNEDAHNPAGQMPGRGGQGRPAAAKPAVEALMINGGGSRSINYQSHLLHLKQINKFLVDSGMPPDRITIISADGSDAAADLAVQNERAEGSGASR